MKARAALLLLLGCVLPAVASAASRYDPALRFRTLTTPHFIIYFHQGEESIARRFAPLAERVYAELTPGLQRTPGGRTHVILVDQNDTANGWATPLPYDTIELTVAPPAMRETIGNMDDWLRLVFVHEYTHVLHLDRSRGYASVFRYVFGRSPVAFPNLFLPPWQTEGLATFEESAVTGRGRVFAGDFRLLVSTAASHGRALPLDRASSDVEDWPSGNTPYAYGGFFHQYLADRYGAEKLGVLATRTAGRFYFLSSPAFKDVYGKSLGELWKEFERQQATDRQVAEESRGRRLTRQGFVAAGPRFARDGQGRTVILYSSRTGHDFPALMSVDLDGHAKRLSSRYLGEETSVVGTAAVFDQQDLSRSVAIRSDLYLTDLESGHTERLTHGGRFVDPAVSPSGRAIAVVALRQGERTLQVFDVPPGAWPGNREAVRAALRGVPRIDVHQPAVEYASPRWSPDGRWLAVARHTRSGLSDIVVFDANGREAVSAASSRTARNVTPAWMPDGRTLLFASDRAVGFQPPPFNIFAVDLSTNADGSLTPGAVYQVTNLATGATYPDAVADGSLLAYVGYTTAGYDVFVLPIDRTQWTPIPDAASSTDDPPSPAYAGQTMLGELRRASHPTSDHQPPDHPTNDHAYSPLPTVLPRYWLPAVEESDGQLRIGAQTGGSDVLGRHVYSATALVRAAGHAEAPGSPRYDWAVDYVYDRWVPSFFASVSDRTHFLQQVLLDDASVVNADLREQNEQLGVALPDRHARYAQELSVSLLLQRQTINVGGLTTRDSDRNGVRMAWVFNNAHTYAYSISPEQGVTIGATGEMVRQGLGALASSNAATVDARGYLRLGSTHSILAVRAGIGAGWGDPRTARRFYLGGSGGNENPASFDSDALNLLRGFDQNSFVGDRLAVVNVEYRVPLLRINRGWGTFPVFLRTLHVTGFFDTGSAWRSGQPVTPLAMSVGGELAAAWRLGYELPLMVAGGVAWPHQPGGQFGSPTAYVRLGYAF